jgi:hypothetical protein
MKIKTSELTGAALCWAAAKADGEQVMLRITPSRLLLAEGETWELPYDPDTNWSQGGPIIERERIVLREFSPIREDWEAEIRIHHINAFGPTPLIAAMRCFVASRLGDTVDVPAELLS